MADAEPRSSEDVLRSQQRRLYAKAAAIAATMLVIAAAGFYLTVYYLPAQRHMKELQVRINRAMDAGDWNVAADAAADLALVDRQRAEQVLEKVEERRRLAYHYFEYRVLNTYHIHDEPVTGVAFAPDGQHVVSESEGGTAAMWRVDDGTVVGERGDVNTQQTLTAFTPSGQIMATADNDEGIIRVLQLPSASEVGRVRSGIELNGIDISANGNYIVGAAVDSTVRVWYRPDGSLVNTLVADSFAVTSAAFSPEAKVIVTGGPEGAVRVWGVP